MQKHPISRKQVACGPFRRMASCSERNQTREPATCLSSSQQHWNQRFFRFITQSQWEATLEYHAQQTRLWNSTPGWAFGRTWHSTSHSVQSARTRILTKNSLEPDTNWGPEAKIFVANVAKSTYEKNRVSTGKAFFFTSQLYVLKLLVNFVQFHDLKIKFFSKNFF